MRIGSARVLIAMVALLFTLTCVAAAFVVGVANGLLILATVFAAIFAWSVGALRASFWSGGDDS